MELRFGENAVLGDQLHIFGCDVGGQALGGGGQITQTPPGSFFLPFVGVAVAAEYDSLVVCEGLTDQFMEGGIKVLSLLQNVRKLAQLLGHDGVQGDVGAGNGLGGTQHTELKFVTGEGQRAGTVSVGGILADGGEHIHADAQQGLFGVHIVGAVYDGTDDGIQLVAQENGYNGRRCFVCTQAVVVAGRGNSTPQKVLIFIHALDKGSQEQQEPGILIGGLAGTEQVLSGVCGQAPVVMLAGAADACEGLFVKQTYQIVFRGALLHNKHDELVVITGGIGIGVDGCQLMLTGGTFVVLGLAEDTQPPELFIQVLHERRNTGTNGSKIMVIQLLTLGGLCTEESPARQPQVLPLRVEILGQQEILLLRANTGDDPLGFGVAEEPQDPHGFPGDFIDGAKQGGLLIQCFSGVREEAGGDVQAAILDKSGGGRVPGGVAAGFKSCPKTARGEGRSVGFTPDQFFAGELHDDPSVAGGRNEGIVLFRGDAGHGLEPVGKMGGTLFGGPVFHGFRDFVGNFQFQGRTGLDTVLPGGVDLGGKALDHGSLIKNIASKNFRDIDDLAHVGGSFHIH